jgi:hypothetical protein
MKDFKTPALPPPPKMNEKVVKNPNRVLLNVTSQQLDKHHSA